MSKEINKQSQAGWIPLKPAPMFAFLIRVCA